MDWFDWESDAGGGSRRIGLIGWMQDHRRLRVWKKAHALAIEVRRATRLFPHPAYKSLQSQMNRAAESIVFNIVEGCGAASQRDFARFLDISIKSTSELEGQLELAKDYGVLSTHKWETLTTEAIDVRRMLCGLRAKVLAADSQSRAPRSRVTHNGKPKTHNVDSLSQTWDQNARDER